MSTLLHTQRIRLMVDLLLAIIHAEYLRNNTSIFTAQGVEVVPFIDSCVGEGKILLHDSCIDKPTPDQYTCSQQKDNDKCDFPFMTSPLAAQWQGGYCQRTCERCSCCPDSGVACAEVMGEGARGGEGGGGVGGWGVGGGGWREQCWWEGVRGLTGYLYAVLTAMKVLGLHVWAREGLQCGRPQSSHTGCDTCPWGWGCTLDIVQ